MILLELGHPEVGLTCIPLTKQLIWQVGRQTSPTKERTISVLKPHKDQLDLLCNGVVNRWINCVHNNFDVVVVLSLVWRGQCCRADNLVARGEGETTLATLHRTITTALDRNYLSWRHTVNRKREYLSHWQIMPGTSVFYLKSTKYNSKLHHVHVMPTTVYTNPLYMWY